MIDRLLATDWFYTLVEWMWWPQTGHAYAFFSSVGGTPLFALGAFGTIAAVYKQHNCKAHWWCPLWAHHKVNGTTASVCHIHHTAEHHRLLQIHHRRNHPNRLSHGESIHPETGEIIRPL